MAIIKQAKNITITVKGDYELVVTKALEKMAEIVNIEATNENLCLVSNKKIISQGNK